MLINLITKQDTENRENAVIEYDEEDDNHSIQNGGSDDENRTLDGRQADSDDEELKTDINAMKSIILCWEKHKQQEWSSKTSLFLSDSISYSLLVNLVNRSDQSVCYEYIKDAEMRQKFLTILLEAIEINLLSLDKCLDSFGSDEENVAKVKLNHLKSTLILCYNWSDNQPTFAKEFSVSENGLSLLFSLITNSRVTDILTEIEHTPPPQPPMHEDSESHPGRHHHRTPRQKLEKVILRIFKYNLFAVYNLSQYYHIFHAKWKECNAFNSLLNLCNNVIKKNPVILKPTLFTDCVVSIANIYSESDLDESVQEDFKVVARAVAKLVWKCGENIRTFRTKTGGDTVDPRLVRRQTVFESDPNQYEVICVRDKSMFRWSFIELINALYRISVNDTLKYLIYNDLKMDKCLRNVILSGNEVEAYYGIKLLWQLCFDKRVCNQVTSDTELVNFIRSKLLVKNQPTQLITVSEGLLWLVSGHEQFNSTRTNNNQEQNKHIMISYSKVHRDVCLSIKKELEKMGHKVWIDVQNISGSSLGSMAEAIEDSFCVIMTMSENYKQSPNCRAEAEYAFQLKKPIVPLILQKNYKPDGWLGIILGSKIFVDFTKYEFHECIRRLKHELKSIHDTVSDQGKSEQDGSSRVTQRPVTAASRRLKWTDEQINTWLTEKEFNTSLVENISPCNSALLEQYYVMLNSVPEFFYNALVNKNSDIKLRDYAYFVCELRKLFE